MKESITCKVEMNKPGSKSTPGSSPDTELDLVNGIEIMINDKVWSLFRDYLSQRSRIRSS